MGYTMQSIISEVHAYTIKSFWVHLRKHYPKRQQMQEQVYLPWYLGRLGKLKQGTLTEKEVSVQLTSLH
jgi:hypothetical protein